LSDHGIDPIGGYFALELPDERRLPYLESARFQSARAAFLALVRAGKPKRIWMPRYICNAMLTPLANAEAECVWYDVNDQLEVDGNTTIGVDDWLLYVNYFGICNKKAEGVLQRFPPDQVVLDYSQSFFAPPLNEALATIYSPRKFFGVPDGGLLISRVPVSLPAMQDTGSFGRMSHLMRRLGECPEAGYAEFQHSEDSLSECEPKRMSRLTERILSSIDFDNASKKRRENFLFLHKQLGEDNQLSLDTSSITGPLCYPFLTHDADLRRRLINNRVFVATYWTDAISRVGDDWAEKMVRNLLPLPIDQRYGQKDMERLVSVILGENT
jgi:hypothetical protein